MEKSLDVKSVEDAKTKVSDIQVVGNSDSFQLLCKASSKNQGWMKSAKAYEIDGVGCIVQVTTQQNEHVAEALTFVPNCHIEDDANDGRKLIGDPPQYLSATTELKSCDDYLVNEYENVVNKYYNIAIKYSQLVDEYIELLNKQR